MRRHWIGGCFAGCIAITHGCAPVSAMPALGVEVAAARVRSERTDASGERWAFSAGARVRWLERRAAEGVSAGARSLGAADGANDGDQGAGRSRFPCASDVLCAWERGAEARAMDEMEGAR